MPQSRRRPEVQAAYDSFMWLMSARVGLEKCEAGEAIAAALEWVLRIGTARNGNPIPELLAEIDRLRGQPVKAA